MSALPSNAHPIQVDAEHYAESAYRSKERFISLWNQIAEIEKLGKGPVLEIGIGPGLLRRNLKEVGIPVVSVDLDISLQPDLVADVRRLPLPDGSYSSVACFQVLEHLPFDQVPSALAELARVAREYVVLSLPDVGAHCRFLVKVPLLPVWRLMIPLDWLMRRRHQFDGQHHWEINFRGFPRGRIDSEIEQAGLRIVRSYRLFENPYHRFYVLRPLRRGDT